MFNTIVRESRKALGALANRLAPAAAELRLRRQIVFHVLQPQLEIAKHSPTAQITVGLAITALVVSGKLSSAAGLASAWFFWKPLTHAVAGGMGAVGVIDAKLLASLERLQTPQVEPATAP